MVQNEKRCIKVCNQVFGLPKSKGRASSSFGIIAAYQNTEVEIRPNYHGFCSWVTIDREKTLLSLGRSGPIDQVSSLPTSENRLFA